MALDLNSVDLSAVEALVAIKSEQDQLADRLKAMESKRSQVSSEVYQRVQSDYRTRQSELSSQAAPLIQRAGEAYRALRAELVDLESAFKTAKLDREEIDFRHALGEFDDKELAARVKAVDARVAEHGQARTKALALKERFLAVVSNESELDASDEDTARMDAIPGVSAKPADSSATVISGPVTPAPAKADPDATLVAALPALKPLPIVPPPPAPAAAANAGKRPRNPDATVVFRQGRLEPRNPEAGSVVQTLGLKPISIGSDPACDLQLSASGIAKRQLEITMTRAGFCIRDVAANGAVKINGEVVQERVLAESDTLSVGPAQFNFRLL